MNKLHDTLKYNFTEIHDLLETVVHWNCYEFEFLVCITVLYEPILDKIK